MENQTGYVMIVIAAPPEGARELARLFVQEKAAACVQVTSPVTSIYVWEGAVREDPEVLLFLKTTTRKIPTVKKLVAERHPYQVPELICLPVTDGNSAYFRWIDDVLSGGGEK